MAWKWQIKRISVCKYTYFIYAGDRFSSPTVITLRVHYIIIHHSAHTHTHTHTHTHITIIHLAKFCSIILMELSDNHSKTQFAQCTVNVACYKI